MENLPLVKWHVKELYNLLIKDPNNAQTARLAVDLETLLNNYFLNQVVSVDFLISAEAVAAANEAESKHILAQKNRA
jgi:hypothetical protein